MFLLLRSVMVTIYAVTTEYMYEWMKEYFDEGEMGEIMNKQRLPYLHTSPGLSQTGYIFECGFSALLLYACAWVQIPSSSPDFVLRGSGRIRQLTQPSKCTSALF